VRKILKLK